MTLAGAVRDAQSRFRLRLSGVRYRQLIEAHARGRLAKAAWEAELKKAKDWKKECLRRERIYLGIVGLRPPTHEQLVEILQSLAGINHGRRCRRDEWSDWNGGKSGPRGCGPGAWDIAVRCIEDG